MTEKEAIELINEYQGLFPCARGEAECLDVAISALEAQIKLKEYIKRLNQPEYNGVVWQKDEVVLLLKELLA